MPGFIDNFLTEWRIGLGAKAVLKDIEKMSSTQGAHLALMLALFRSKMTEVQVLDRSVTVEDVVERPFTYRKELCLAAYYVLEDIREASRERVKSYESFGVSPDPAIMAHIEICDLALSILMSTVGVACSSSTLETVRYSWEQITAHIPTEKDVALAMLMPEYIVNDIIEQPLETDAWLKLGRNVPHFLKPTI
jgi:hypothetical protein